MYLHILTYVYLHILTYVFLHILTSVSVQEALHVACLEHDITILPAGDTTAESVCVLLY